MARQTRLRFLVGFGVAAVIIFLFVYAIGWDEVVSTLSKTDLGVFSLGLVSSFVCLVAWSAVWNRVLSVIDHALSRGRITLIFLSAMFANYVTPLGQVGGEPFIAYVLSKSSDIDYEHSLAAVMTSDFLNLIPFFSYAVVGFSYFVTRRSFNSDVRNYAAVFVVVAAVAVSAALFIWHRRDLVESFVLRVAGFLRKTVGKLSSNLRTALREEDVKERIDGFFETLDLFSENRREMATAVVFSHIGWFFFILPLYTSFLSLGYNVPLGTTLLIIPVSGLAGFIPLPGGLGGVEIAIAVTIFSLTGLSLPAASAAALLYRLCVYWFTLLVGGISSMYLSVDLRRIET